MIKINLDDKENLINTFKKLKAGDRVLLSGHILTARDAGHQRLANLLKNGEKPPYNTVNSVIYYAGPTDTPPGSVIGSIGPTTSVRMDSYADLMPKLGVVATIGKGERSPETVKSYLENSVLYFIATGGCGALLSNAVKSCEIVAFSDLGCEAMRDLYVEDFPVLLALDYYGGNIFND
ncbi:MAG: FumA C-terminus/TtdB family hydratase beta subunit [Christensenellaceae bacterium]